MSALTDAWITTAERHAKEGFGFFSKALAASGKTKATFVDGEFSAAHLLAGTTYLWRLSTYPVVELEENLAARLVLTKLPENVPDLRWPWKAFMVEIPAFMAAELQFGDEVAALIAGLDDGQFGFYLVTCGFNPENRSRQAIANEGQKYTSLAKFCELNEASGEHAIRCMARVVVGALCELNSVPTSRPRTRAAIKHEVRGMPTAWRTRLTRPVSVDFREAARSYVRGEGNSVFLQRLVRGHWQHYWVGKRDGERRCVLKHKEPFWQGNPDAPIALRSHVLKGGEAKLRP